MNLLDYCAIALPAGFRDNHLPFGITLFAAAFRDRLLLSMGGCFQQASGFPLGATTTPLPPLASPLSPDPEKVRVAVCGAHMQGLPLNWQLTQRGGRMVERTTTAPVYRFYALADGPPFRPGLIRHPGLGRAIEVEVWELPVSKFGSFVAGIPQPLGIGKLELADGRWENGFICEGYAIADAQEISQFGGWRDYLAGQASQS